MVYRYKCTGCKANFEVIKSMKDVDRNENCTKCGEFATLSFEGNRYYLSGTKVTHPEYNPGLGCVVKDAQHKDRLMKTKGVVEIGNDFKSGESMQKSFDTDRERKLEKRWEND